MSIEVDITNRKAVVGYLSKNIVRLVFVKANGDKRIMFATLIPVHLPEKAVSCKDNAHNTNTVRVWDIEADDWRSFCLDSVKSFEARSLHDLLMGN